MSEKRKGASSIVNNAEASKQCADAPNENNEREAEKSSPEKALLTSKVVELRAKGFSKKTSLQLQQENRRASMQFLKSLHLNDNLEAEQTVNCDVAEPHAKRQRRQRTNDTVIVPRRSSRHTGVSSSSHSRNEKTEVEIVKRMPIQENVIGELPGCPVGTHRETRLELSHLGIHRPTVAGIHGNSALGCYSVALSGGYEDDIDSGETFTYTGSGGRDLRGTSAKRKNLRTAPQTTDQTLNPSNRSLLKSIETGNAIRVVRGFKLKSQYAPLSGYRYDGLYTVNKYWVQSGLSGFDVYRFEFTRIASQALPPWVINQTAKEKLAEAKSQMVVSSQEVYPENEAQLNVSASQEIQPEPKKISASCVDNTATLKEHLKHTPHEKGSQFIEKSWQGRLRKKFG